MMHWRPRPTRTPQPRWMAFWLPAILLLGLATAAPAVVAPEYALSGQAPALEKTVLAQTPTGPVTALDVLMLDQMRDRAVANIPLTAWLNPMALESTPYRPAMKSAVERLLAYQALAAKAGDWQPPADTVRVRTFGAAMAVWVENVVKPEVKVLDSDIDRYYLAHPEKYLRRLRAQVRYIFVAANMTDPQDKQRALTTLEGVARDIQDGRTTFEEAARQHSQAPSASEGGLLPPFYNGTFFNEFDAQTFQLQPGKISPVFEGPEGYYLVQMVQTWPPHNIPITEVREQIRATLTLDHVRHYYNYLMAQLTRKQYVQNFATTWNYLNLESPIVQLGPERKLSRADFIRFFGGPVDANYQTRTGDVVLGAGYWVEGELIMADLAARGLAEHPWIQRARALAAMPLRADQVYKTQVPAERYAPSQAMETILNNKLFIQGMRTAHVIQFEVAASKKDNTPKTGGGSLLGAPAAPAAPQAGSAEAMTLVNSIAAQLAGGVLPTEPIPVKLTEWLQTAGANPEQLASAVENLQRQADNTPWPGVKVSVKDRGWVNVAPGSPWYDSLKSVTVGQASQPVQTGNASIVNMVVAERPIDLKEWEAKPILLRSLAFQIEASKLFAGEVLRLRQSGQVQYTFQ